MLFGYPIWRPCFPLSYRRGGRVGAFAGIQRGGHPVPTGRFVDFRARGQHPQQMGGRFPIVTDWTDLLEISGEDA